MTTPIVAGFGVAAVAMTGRMAILAFEAWKTAPPRLRKFYEGGFEPEMTRREAAMILGPGKRGEGQGFGGAPEGDGGESPGRGGKRLHRHENKRSQGADAWR
jgi:hypothetical protein